MTTILGYDFETTSIDTATCCPVQTALVEDVYNGDEFEYNIIMNSLSFPMGRDIEPGAQEVHKISMDMVESAPDDKSVMRTLGLLINDYKSKGDVILVGYNNTSFDDVILKRYLPNLEVKTLDFYKLVLRDPDLQKNGLKLKEVFEGYVGFEMVDAHDASVDVIALLELLKKYMVNTGKSIETLYEELSKPEIFEVFPFGKHRGKMLEEVPQSYLEWVNENFDNKSEDLQLTINHYLDL